MKISACVITKNEEKHLPQWIESVKQIADELIVVDTGSTDRTVEIAKAAGAQVYYFEWIKDFAAAKNFSLDRATGEWIINLDADEYFPNADCEKVKELIRRYHPDRRVGGFLCRRIDIDPEQDNKYLDDVTVLRVFRNSRFLRYEGRIHELLVSHAKNSMEMKMVPGLTIMHTGYAKSTSKEKSQRNLDILLEEQKQRGVKPQDNYYLADCYCGLEEYEKAIACTRQTIADGVRFLGLTNRPYLLLIRLLIMQKHPVEEVDAAIAAAREKYPRLPEFSMMDGLAAWNRKDFVRAEASLKKGLELYEGLQETLAEDLYIGDLATNLLPESCRCLAMALLQRGAGIEAQKLLERIVAIRPEDAVLADLLRQLNDRVEQEKPMDISKDINTVRQIIYAALERKDFVTARRAIENMRPAYETEALGLLTSIGIESGDADSAEQNVRALLQLMPKDIYARFLAARVRYMRGETVKTACELSAMLKEKNIPRVYREKIGNLLGQCCRFLGDSMHSTEAYLGASRAAEDKSLAALEYSDYLFNMHYLPPRSAVARKKQAQGFGVFFRDTPQFMHRRRSADKKIRIGYISPDFRDHVVVRFSYAMLASFNTSEFEVYAYMNGPEDDISRNLSKKVTAWRNIAGMPAEDAARLIYEDGVDILFDLAGHTKGNSLSALAYKPAPIQISGIGYFASTGLPTVDYFLGDTVLDDEQEQEAFTERLLKLPHSHFCYVPLKEETLSGAAPCIRNGYVTFGSFNNFTKVTDEVLSAWAELLRRVPNSRLFLKAEVFDHADSRAYTLERMEKAGIELGRVRTEGISRNYLQQYNEMDVALDTFPYPGGGTTCDALYMGVPCVTLNSGTHGGRFGVSLLKNIGLSELTASTVEEYIEKAAGLAADTELLDVLHKNVRTMMEHSPLMDRTLYMKELENAYHRIWRTYCGAQSVPDYTEVKNLAQQAEEWQAAGDTTQTLAAADRILAAKPSNRPLVEKLAVMYLDAGDKNAVEAVSLLQLEEKPYGFGLFLAAGAFSLSGDRDQARQLAQLALSYPGLERWQCGAVHHLLAELHKSEGNRAAAAQEYLASSMDKDMENGKLTDYSNYLLNLHFDEHPAEEMLAAAKGYNALLNTIKPYEHSLAKHHHPRLRVGYISPDFRRHVVAGFSQPLFRQYNRERFEVFAYANCAEDDVSRALAQSADHWKNIRGLKPAEAARLIHEDEIDILVDLSGHTGDNALPVLAYKPAPVQLTGIGYFATTGLSTVDYFLSDAFSETEGEDAFFIEKLLKLPHCHLCYAPLDGADVPVSPLPADRNGYVTFGSLNQFDKVTDEMLKAWAAILQKLPDSHLFLKAGAFDDAVRREKILHRLAEAGLPLERVEFEGYTADYFRAYDRIDIALDSYPYPGGGTTCDALYRGVPVITLYGQHHHERFGYSLLSNVGLGGLAAGSLQEYVERAEGLANDRELLRLLRSNLRTMMQQSPVMDGALYMKDLETAFELIWAKWLTK